MPKMIFRGAFIRYADLREDESGLFCRLHMTSDLSDTVSTAMEWDTIPENVTSAKLAGELVTNHLFLTPNGKELKKNELQINCNRVSDFELRRVKDDEDSYHKELRFIVGSVQPAAIALIEDYKRVVGKGVAQLRVDYEKQSDLPLGDEEEAEEADEDQEPIEENLTGAALASHREMGQRTRRGEKAN